MSTKERYEEQVGYDLMESEGIVYDNHNPKQIKYGRVTKSGHAMIPLPNIPFKQLAIEDSGVFAIDFVADAFRDLSDKYNDMGLKIFNEDGDGNLLPHKAYEDPLALYKTYIFNILKEFIDFDLLLDDDSIKVHNFTQYVERFHRYIQRKKTNKPYLFSSFVKSSLCPPHVSGLVIELDRVFHDDFDSKYDYSTEISVNNCISLARKFGFIIPKQSPWCLVANLNSTVMYNYAIEYDVPSRKKLINSYYIECRGYDIDLLKDYLVESFNQFMEATNVRLIKSLCDTKGLKGRIKVLDLPSVDPTISFTDNDWVRFYFRVMSAEQKVKNSKVLFDSIMKDCYYMLEKYGFDVMHDYALSKLKFKKTDKYR